MNQDNPYFSISYEALKSSPLFSKVSDETLLEILQNCEPFTWKKKDTISYELTKKYCFFIVKGRVKMIQVDPNSGRSVAPFLLSKGDIFDIFCLLDGKEHSAFYVAVDDVITIAMPISKAREFIEKHPEFNQEFLPYLGKMMRQLEEFGYSLVFYDTTTRLANLILKHACADKDNKTKVKLLNNLSHESLAEMIGTVRSVITTQLKKLKEEEIILHQKGEIIIKNLEKLLKKLSHPNCKK